MNAAAQGNSKICVLDDDESFVRATGQLLSSVGLPTEQFTDPYAFLDYARIHQPRLAIIDISMPAINGLEVQMRLRTDSPSTRVVVLTARDDSSTRTKAMAGGASAFFLKAAGEDEFLARVQSLSSES
jgi:FixJ family two-component response regulator